MNKPSQSISFGRKDVDYLICVIFWLIRMNKIYGGKQPRKYPPFFANTRRFYLK